MTNEELLRRLVNMALVFCLYTVAVIVLSTYTLYLKISAVESKITAGCTEVQKR